MLSHRARHAHWTLHQTSRHPLPAREVDLLLAMLPNGTRHAWHNDSDVAAFMSRQPIRFQRHFAQLQRIEHRIDLWRYLFLHQHGGIYLDADNALSAPLSADLLGAVDSLFVYDSLFDNMHNGFFVVRPRNPVLLATAELMVAMGPSKANGWSLSRYHHNLRMLKWELCNLIEPGPNGTRRESLPAALAGKPPAGPPFPRRCDAWRFVNGTRAKMVQIGPVVGKWTAAGDLTRRHLYYVDSCGWRTLVLTHRDMSYYSSVDGSTPLIRPRKSQHPPQNATSPPSAVRCLCRTSASGGGACADRPYRSEYI